MNCDKPIIVLPSIDGDPGINFPRRHGKAESATDIQQQNYREAVQKLLEVFDGFSFTGKTTWFVNEIDVNWSRDFPDLLSAFIKRGDNVALHIHYDGLFASPKLTTKEACLTAARGAIDRLQSVTGKRIRHYRSGCYLQREWMYASLRELELETISDVFPGLKTTTRSGFNLDNSSVPVGSLPWRHNPSNWLDCQSAVGHFLHIPVSAGAIDHLPMLPQKVLDHHIKVVCWGIHPHELQAEDGRISDSQIESLERSLKEIEERLSPIYMNFDHYLEQASVTS